MNRKSKQGNENEERPIECRKGLFRKKDIRPESFDFSISGEERSKRMRIKVSAGKKEITLDMDQKAILDLFAGIMDSAPELFDIEEPKKVRDIMYA